MIVTIMYRNTYDGGDGWQYGPMTVAIPDTCPECGGPRGKPFSHTFHEGGEWFTVDRWTNPCGHVDKYAQVYREAKLLAAAKAAA